MLWRVVVALQLLLWVTCDYEESGGGTPGGLED